MRRASAGRYFANIVLGAAAIAVGAGMAAAGEDADPRAGTTATPIKHLIVVLAENRSFDHVFATYRPRDGQRVGNLLSRGIVDENGMPGPNFGRAAQFTVTPQPKYFIAPPDANKSAYVTLPPPDLDGAPGTARPRATANCNTRASRKETGTPANHPVAT